MFDLIQQVGRIKHKIGAVMKDTWLKFKRWVEWQLVVHDSTITLALLLIAGIAAATAVSWFTK